MNTYDEELFNKIIKKYKYYLISCNDGIYFSNSENGMSVRISNIIELSVLHDINIETM